MRSILIYSFDNINTMEYKKLSEKDREIDFDVDHAPLVDDQSALRIAASPQIQKETAQKEHLLLRRERHSIENQTSEAVSAFV